MSKSILNVATGLFLASVCVLGQATNPCDLNQDSVVDTKDVQAALNMTIGLAPCTANIVGADVCNIEVVQRVLDASLGAACFTSTGIHTVLLNWTASGSSNVVGYKVYRGTVSGGPYTLLAQVGSVTAFRDGTVVSGQTYFYVVTSLDNNNNESGYSAETEAMVPTP